MRKRLLYGTMCIALSSMLIGRVSEGDTTAARHFCSWRKFQLRFATLKNSPLRAMLPYVSLRLPVTNANALRLFCAMSLNDCSASLRCPFRTLR